MSNSRERYVTLWHDVDQPGPSVATDGDHQVVRDGGDGADDVSYIDGDAGGDDDVGDGDDEGGSPALEAGKAGSLGWPLTAPRSPPISGCTVSLQNFFFPLLLPCVWLFFHISWTQFWIVCLHFILLCSNVLYDPILSLIMLKDFDGMMCLLYCSW